MRCWFLRRAETGVPGENLSVQSREPTNSTHIWRRIWETNPGYVGGRRLLSPLRHPFTPIYVQCRVPYMLNVMFLPIVYRLLLCLFQNWPAALVCLKLNALLLPNWERRAWPNCWFLNRRLNLASDRTQSDALQLSIGRSGRPIVKNGKHPINSKNDDSSLLFEASFLASTSLRSSNIRIHKFYIRHT